MIIWWIRLISELEVEANSLERIKQYLGIEHEPKPVKANTPPAYWPASGELAVEKLSARYSTVSYSMVRVRKHPLKQFTPGRT